MAKRTERTRANRRAVRLTRAHLQMVKAFAAAEPGRYAAHCLHVRRNGDDVSVQALEGHVAAAMPAELIDDGELPVGLPGDEMADGAVVLIDAETAALALRALPKKSTLPILQSAYLCVDDKAACLAVFKPEAHVFRCVVSGTPVPDAREMTPEPGSLRLKLNAALLGPLCGFVAKHLYDARGGKPSTITFDFAAKKTYVTTRLEAPGGFVAVLMPVTAKKSDGDFAACSETWVPAQKAADRKMRKIREEADADSEKETQG